VENDNNSEVVEAFYVEQSKWTKVWNMHVNDALLDSHITKVKLKDGSIIFTNGARHVQ